MRFYMIFCLLLLSAFTVSAQQQYPYPNSSCPFCPGPDSTDIFAIPLDEDGKEEERFLDEFNGPRSNNRDSSITK